MLKCTQTDHYYRVTLVPRPLPDFTTAVEKNREAWDYYYNMVWEWPGDEASTGFCRIFATAQAQSIGSYGV